MKDLPSCFGENAIQIADSSSSNVSRTSANLVTSVYQCRLRARPCLITLTWNKNLMGPSLSVEIEDSTNQSLCKVDIRPWLFSKKKGSKTVELDDSSDIDMYWDFSSAKFGSGPQPLDSFYFAIVSNKQIVLLLGDMRKEALKKSNAATVNCNAVFVAKRERIFGKKLFFTKAQFHDHGPIHDLMIEFDTINCEDPCLIIRIDAKNAMKVKHLRWKFRGNHTILIDGIPIEVYWDVHNWLFGTSLGSAVFMFKTNMSAEKLWDPIMLHRSHSQSHNLGFSLMLNVWKHE
ncbi:hypothetical protein Nepgr_009642 [Nepenthes gracilis]|uniref:Uncharacterized protein n=1 Tax=Nepenthes gracilis TaxID=150966 RepID=A0AAD3SBP2_NEPGR|nr:hypothetical protein Nepgr_009642 [Nepenthes gracilis]